MSRAIKDGVAQACLLLSLTSIAACDGKASDRTASTPGTPTQTSLDTICPTPKVTDDGVSKQLALIVGVSKYANSQVESLPGARPDAQRIYDLLTDKNGYGFAKENVCLLTDEKATNCLLYTSPSPRDS